MGKLFNLSDYRGLHVQTKPFLALKCVREVMPVANNSARFLAEEIHQALIYRSTTCASASGIIVEVDDDVAVVKWRDFEKKITVDELGEIGFQLAVYVSGQEEEGRKILCEK